MTDETKKYLSEYRKSKLHRIPLDVPNDLYEDFKFTAEYFGGSVNGTLKALMRSYIKSHERDVSRKSLFGS